MNEQNFLARVNFFATGDAYLKEDKLSLHGHVRASNDNLPLVTADAPTWAEEGISFDDGETAFLDFDIPADYDEGKDICALRLKVIPSADAAHTTDIGVTTAQSIFRAGYAEITDTRTAVAEDATASTDQLVRDAILDISGSGYKAGDHVRLTLDVNNSGTTELVLVGIGLIYMGGLAAYNDADRFRDLG